MQSSVASYDVFLRKDRPKMGALYRGVMSQKRVLESLEGICGSNQQSHFEVNFGLKEQNECDDVSEQNVAVWNVSVEYTSKDDVNCLTRALGRLHERNENNGELKGIDVTCSMLPGSGRCKGMCCEQVTLPPSSTTSIAMRMSVWFAVYAVLVF